MTYVIGRGRYGRETYPTRLRLPETGTCTSYVQVESLADLPAPSGGVITLEPNTNYQLCGTVDISPNSLVLSDGTTLSGRTPLTDGLTSSGFTASALININAAINTLITNLTLSAPGATLFDADLNLTGRLSLILCSLVQCAALGIVQNFNHFAGLSIDIEGNDDGWTLLGTNEDITWVDAHIEDNLGTFTAWTVPAASGTTARNALFSDSIMDLAAGQTGFDFPDPASGFAIARGSILGIFFSGAGDPLAVGVGKITKGTPEWRISDSSPLVDSIVAANAAYALTGGGGNSTGALVAGTFVPIPSAPSPFVASAMNERFTASAAGLLTYIGIDPIQVHVTVGVSIDMTGAGTANYGAAIFYNGSLVANSEQTNQVVSAGAATSAVTTTALVTLNNGDTLQGYLRNNTNGNPINVYAAQINAIEA